MRLRQVALVASELAPARNQLFALLGLQSDYQDPGVGEFGLENSVMAIGDTFLEVVVPVTDNTTAGRHLERRGGDGGYMILVQSDDLSVDSARIEKLGVRKVWEVELDDVSAFHMHPADVGGAIVSIDEMRPAKSWRWGGPAWRENTAARVQEIVAVELQASDPEKLANRWAEVLGQQLTAKGDGLVMPLERSEIRFVEDKNGRGDGVSALDIRTDQLAELLKNAGEQGLSVDGSAVTVCGMTFNFVT